LCEPAILKQNIVIHRHSQWHNGCTCTPSQLIDSEEFVDVFVEQQYRLQINRRSLLSTGYKSVCIQHKSHKTVTVFFHNSVEFG